MANRPEPYTMTVADMLGTLEPTVGDLKQLPPDTPVHYCWVEYHPRSQVVDDRINRECARFDCIPIMSFPICFPTRGPKDGKSLVFTFMIPSDAVPREWVEEMPPDEGEQAR